MVCVCARVCCVYDVKVNNRCDGRVMERAIAEAEGGTVRVCVMGWWWWWCVCVLCVVGWVVVLELQ